MRAQTLTAQPLYGQAAIVAALERIATSLEKIAENTTPVELSVEYRFVPGEEDYAGG